MALMLPYTRWLDWCEVAYFVAERDAASSRMRAVLHARQGQPFSLGGSACTLALHLLRRTGEEAVRLEASTGHEDSADADPYCHRCLQVGQQCDQVGQALRRLLQPLLQAVDLPVFQQIAEVLA